MRRVTHSRLLASRVISTAVMSTDLIPSGKSAEPTKGPQIGPDQPTGSDVVRLDPSAAEKIKSLALDSAKNAPSAAPLFQPITDATDLEGESIQSMGAEVTEIPTDLQCEECSASATLRKWRWCSNCHNLICEKCAVGHRVREGKNGANILDYGVIHRESDKELWMAIQKVRTTIETLQKQADDEQSGNNAIDCFARFKSDLNFLSKKNGKAISVFKWQLRNLNAFAQRQVSIAQQSVQEKYSLDTMTLLKEAIDSQVSFEKYLATLIAHVEGASRKLSEIFTSQ